MTSQRDPQAVSAASSFEAEVARRAAEGARERRWMRLGVAAAVVVHAGVFAANWPRLTRAEAPPEPERWVVHQLQPFDFQEPPELPLDVRVPESRRVPIPDDTPHDPEPLVRPEQTPPRLDIDTTGLVLGPVDAPPPPEPDPPRVIRVGGAVKAPEVLLRIEPVYPEVARRVKLEGTVIIELLIDPQGEVAETTVLRGLPMGLTEAALDAVRQWRFAPSTIDGRPVSVRYVISVIFRLR